MQSNSLAGWRVLRAVAVTAIIGAFLVGAQGSQCDSTATAAFRNTALDAVGSGVKTIFDGVLDGTVAAIKSTDSGSSTTN